MEEALLWLLDLFYITKKFIVHFVENNYCNTVELLTNYSDNQRFSKNIYDQDWVLLNSTHRALTNKFR